MPELASPRSNPLQPILYTPTNPAAYFSRPQAVTAPIAPTAAADTYAKVSEALAGMAPAAINAYDAGKATQAKQTAADAVTQRIQQGDLTGMTLSGQGAAQLRVPTELENEAERAKIEYYKNKPAPGSQKGDLYDFMNRQWDGVSQPTSATKGAPGQPSIPATGGVLGKVTDYGQQDDPFKDSASLGQGKFAKMGPTGAWNNPLSETSLAISPDIEQQFKAAGIKQGDRVRLKLANGQIVERTWDDRTMQDEQATSKFGKPLRGRFDFYSPGGASPMRDAEVVGFEPANGTAAVDPAQRDLISASAGAAGEAIRNISPSQMTASTSGGDLAQMKVADVTRRPSMGRDPKTGAFIYAPTPKDVTAIFPTGDKVQLEGWKEGDQEKGRIFDTPEAAIAEGLDPTDAEVLPDGKIRVSKFKQVGTDIKGRGKITDSTKSKLESAAMLASSIDGLMEDYDALDKQNKAGPIMGRVEQGKQAIGMGGEESSKISAQMNTSLFKIARMLNGAGVLTDKDIKRAEDVAPTITMGRSQFKGQLDAVKGVIADSLSTWLQTNAGSATEEQVAMANKAIESLGGKAPAMPTTTPGSAAPAAAPATPAAATPAAPAASGNPTVDRIKAINAQFKELQADWVAGKFKGDPREKEVEAALRAKGLL